MTTRPSTSSTWARTSGVVRLTFEMLEGLKIVEDEGEHEDAPH